MVTQNVVQDFRRGFAIEFEGAKRTRGIMEKPLEEVNRRGSLEVHSERFERTRERFWNGGRERRGISAQTERLERGPDLEELREGCRVVRPIGEIEGGDGWTRLER